MAGESGRGDLILPPYSFAHLLDKSKGAITTVVGPNKVPMSDQDRCVKFNSNTRRFDELASLDQGVQSFITAPEGAYIVLENPAPPGKDVHPAPNSNQSNVPDLQIGKKMNIRGPRNFALWPGQAAQVIEGHILRSNQYLLCRINNPKAAAENWDNQIIMPQGKTGEAEKSTPTITQIESQQFATGQLIIIKGSEVSFYIPPTGIEVIPETRTTDSGSTTQFVREANTLESLEFAILTDESGNRRYPKGPQVVFPNPTERFETHIDEDTNKPTRRYKARNLTPLQGIYVQVIAPYNDDGTPAIAEDRQRSGLPPKAADHQIGEQLFITGENTPIYYPRPEHAILNYGGTQVHSAVVIPKGEGRYVLSRRTGEVNIWRGPDMLLADPRTQSIISRILSDRQVTSWFPGNPEALEFNHKLMEAAGDIDVASQSFVSQASFRMRQTKGSGSGYGYETASSSPVAAAATLSMSRGLESFSMTARSPSGDKSKGATPTTPPALTLDTKYEGVVNISPYIGYAVSVVDKTGNRQVVVGPNTHLLEYDEGLDEISLSTGTPKNHDNVIRTPYLHHTNVRVTDQIVVETLDMVKITLTISCRLNFEGDPNRWFRVGNYVKMLCQHNKSRMSRAAKRYNIAEFYDNAIDYTRDTILGTKDEKTNERPGLPFEENGMRVFDVEVTQVMIQDSSISKLLQDQMVATFRETLQLANLSRQRDFVKKCEALNQDIAQRQHETTEVKAKLAVATIVADFQLSLQRRMNEIEEQKRLLALEDMKQSVQDHVSTSQLARQKAARDLDIAEAGARQQQAMEYMYAESQALVSRMLGVQSSLGDILMAISSNQTMETLAKASAPLEFLGGTSISDVIQKSFMGTPFAAVLAQMAARVDTANDGRRSSNSDMVAATEK